MGISQQFETQHDNPLKVIYVQGGWLSGIDFQVTSTRFELKEALPSFDIRICPESLMEQVRTNVVPVTFQPFSKATQI